MTELDLETLDWDKAGGLIPAIVQDATTGSVLMLGYMSRDAAAQTCASRQVIFYSRSRQGLWRKGESSGNALEVVDVAADCDRDALLVQARPSGPTCHRGTTTCFDDGKPRMAGLLGTLELTVDDRVRDAPGGSYVAGLVASGSQRLAQKVGEEGVEFALATAAGDRDGMTEEGADLLFHLLVALRAADLSVADVLACLAGRQRPSAGRVV